jgi:hypothetical protein
MQRTARESGSATDSALLLRIQRILRAAQASAARTVNTAHVISSWLIGREIVEDEQRGRARASYQDRTLKQLAERLTKTFGAGYSAENLKRFRRFYLVYPAYLNREQIGYALHTQFGRGSAAIVSPPAAGKSAERSVPGSVNLNLAWGHYRVLMRVDNPQARSFYEIEAIKNSWSTRELERQVASLLYERFAKSRDRQGVMRLAIKGVVHEKPIELFKDPTIILSRVSSRRCSRTCNRSCSSWAADSHLSLASSALRLRATTSISTSFSIPPF